MGLSTIVSMLCYVAVPVWGNAMLVFTEIIFWINAVIALLICFSILLLMYILESPTVIDTRFTVHPHTITTITGQLLLPVVTLIDIAATGAVLCSVIPPGSAALPRTMLASYAIWGISFPLANVIIVLFFLRLTLYKVRILSCP